MNLLKRLLSKFKRKQPERVPLLTPIEDAKLKASLQPKPAPKPQAKGRVIKQTRSAEYEPNYRRRGGRVVKTMPRQLQRMKAAQEKVEDDD